MLKYISYGNTKYGNTFHMEILKLFLSVGLHNEKSCRENILQFQKSDFGMNSGQTMPTFYKDYPEIEEAAKLFVLEEIQKKSCNFRVLDLCNFIDS